MRKLPVIILLLASASQAWADARVDYMIHCMGCHRMDGAGMPPEVPTFDAVLGRMITTRAGRNYLVQVPGAAQAPVDDAALADIINYVLREFGDAGEFKAFTTTEVGRARRTIDANPAQTRTALLAALDGTR